MYGGLVMASLPATTAAALLQPIRPPEARVVIFESRMGAHIKASKPIRILTSSLLQYHESNESMTFL